MKIMETYSAESIFKYWEQSAVCEISSVTKSKGKDICETNSMISGVQQENICRSESDQGINGWINYVKEKFYSAHNVESIYLAIENDKIDMWIVIPRRNFKLVRHLIDLEMEVLDLLDSIQGVKVLIEFHIVYRCGSDEIEFIPKEAIILPK